MGTYYLFSDFSEENGFSLVESDFKKDIKNYNKIVFIASCPTIKEVTDKYVEKYLQWFNRIGINFENTVVLDNRWDYKTMINSINEASLIYLMGGSTDLQMEFLLKNKLIDSILKASCLVMGLSAGAINMGKTSVLTKNSGHEKQQIYSGIGVVDKSVIPHFTLDNFDDDLKKISYKYLLYAMCDESAIIIRDNKCIYYGDVYVINKGNLEKLKIGC